MVVGRTSTTRQKHGQGVGTIICFSFEAPESIEHTNTMAGQMQSFMLSFVVSPVSVDFSLESFHIYNRDSTYRTTH